jgi:hypothetical protein
VKSKKKKIGANWTRHSSVIDKKQNFKGQKFGRTIKARNRKTIFLSFFLSTFSFYVPLISLSLSSFFSP